MSAKAAKMVSGRLSHSALGVSVALNNHPQLMPCWRQTDRYTHTHHLT